MFCRSDLTKDDQILCHSARRLDANDHSFRVLNHFVFAEVFQGMYLVVFTWCRRLSTCLFHHSATPEVAGCSLPPQNMAEASTLWIGKGWGLVTTRACELTHRDIS